MLFPKECVYIHDPQGLNVLKKGCARYCNQTIMVSVMEGHIPSERRSVLLFLVHQEELWLLELREGWMGAEGKLSHAKGCPQDCHVNWLPAFSLVNTERTQGTNLQQMLESSSVKPEYNK